MPKFLLTLIIFSPLLFLPFLFFFSSGRNKAHRLLAVSAFSVQLLLSVYLLFASFGGNYPTEYLPWIRFMGENGQLRLAVDYLVGVDGLSLLFVPLSAFVMLIATLTSRVQRHSQGYFALLLLLGTSIMGCFLALDFFLFYLFFEFMLFPMYFLIGIWGGVRKEYAAIKFFLYTLLGSVFILVAMIALYTSVAHPESVPQGSEAAISAAAGSTDWAAAVGSFQFSHATTLSNYLPQSRLHPDNPAEIFGLPVRYLIFLCLMVGLMIKLPALPFHTWLPDAHVEASTPISLILAGLLLKVGGYAMIRIAYPIFPDAAEYFSLFLGIIAVATILYGALVALGTPHFKKMVAYASLAHMGFVLLGIASLTEEGTNGAIFQMISHGIISPMMFLLAGVLYQRTGNLDIENYKGLLQKMPVYGAFTILAFFASLGLPGFSGFIGELLVFLGAFKSAYFPTPLAVIATLGLLLAAGYHLWLLQRMFMGSFSLKYEKWATKLKKLTLSEKLILGILAIFTIIPGIFPRLILDITSPFVDNFLQSLFDLAAQLK